MNAALENLDARIVSNAILEACWVRGYKITNLKLQKLLFLCHAFYLIKNQRSSLVRGSFEAWQYGPVHREAYDAFKSFGENPITQKSVKTNPITGEKTELPTLQDIQIQDRINEVVQFYGNWSAGSLVELTHKKETPWDYVVKTASKEANVGLKISNELIIQRFKYHWFGDKVILTGESPNDEKQIIA